MIRGVVAGLVLAIFAAVIGGYAVVRAGVVPANADARPSSLEAWAARTSLHATLDRVATANTSMPASDRNLVAGIKLYGENCAVCHGDATANPTKIAKGFYQKPPQLAKDGVEDDPVGVTYWKIAHGIRWTGMPSFKDTLSDTQMWQLAMFLKMMDHLPPAPHKAWQQMKNTATASSTRPVSQRT